jgi:hypothetical protein
MTSSCCSCHHAARTWLHWPPGPSNQAYLSSPHLEASLATTFRACSSPAPTPVKPQTAPAILSQESVHTTLSITHHTRKRPSTGPQSPPWWVNWQHTYIVTREKIKRKETNKKETSTSDRKPTKGKEKDHLKKTSPGPLRQGQRLDTSKTKLCSSKERKPPNHSSKTTKSSPCTRSPWTNATPPGWMQTTWRKQSSYISSALTGQTGRHHWSDQCATCEQGQHSDQSDRWLQPVRPVHTIAQKWLETTWKPSKCIQ